jgi:hypothetical protein
VVLYDDLAGRWFFSQFSVGEGIQCVAVSVTSDPLGPYHRYAFQVSPNAWNDYPKLGVWDDGGGGQSAYTFTVRDFLFGFFFQGVGAGVMERDAMLAGLPAKFVKFTNPCVAGDCVEGQLPPHLAGQSAPSGACPVFWTAADAQFDDTPWPNDGYRNHRLCVDWSNTANSTYTEGTIVPAGTEFNRSLGNISPIAGGGDSLDSLPFFTMYRAQYRWFETDTRQWRLRLVPGAGRHLRTERRQGALDGFDRPGRGRQHRARVQRGERQPLPERRLYLSNGGRRCRRNARR